MEVSAWACVCTVQFRTSAARDFYCARIRVLTVKMANKLLLYWNAAVLQRFTHLLFLRIVYSFVPLQCLGSEIK